MAENEKMIIPARQCGMLVAAYIPMQKWENILDLDEGLSKGTIFADLYKPFLGAEVNKNGR